MGDTDNRESAGISIDAVVVHMHWRHTGECVLVGGAAPYLQSLHKGEGMRGGELQEVPVVETGGTRKVSHGNLGGDLAGG